MIVFDDPQELAVRLVLRSGQVVAEAGQMLPFELPDVPRTCAGSMNINWHTVDSPFRPKDGAPMLLVRCPDR